MCQFYQKKNHFNGQPLERKLARFFLEMFIFYIERQLIEFILPNLKTHIVSVQSISRE